MAPPVPMQPKALPVPKQLMVHCPENEALSRFFLEKWRSMMDQPGGLSENLYRTFAVANRNLCASKEHIRTLHDFSKIKGVGQWLIRIMKEFFEQSSQDLSSTKGNKSSGTKAYVPRKNTAPYAILITLHRSSISGKKSMLKQDLIDAAEASGLSQGAIGYRLTPEGHATACECLSRAGLDGSAESLDIASGHDTSTASHSSEHHSMGHSVADTMSTSCMTNTPNRTVASHSPETACSFSATKRPCYYNAEVQTKNCRDKEIILCDSDSEEQSKLQSFTTMGSTEINMLDKDAIFMDNSVLAMPPRRSNESFLEAYEVVLTLDNRENFGFKYSAEGIIFCDSDSEEAHRKDSPLKDNGPSAEFSMLHRGTSYMSNAMLAMPPRQSNENFLEAYEVVLILDDREKFGLLPICADLREVADNIRAQIHQDVSVEVRRLPIGDSIWVARRREDGTEYVLDYIVERKNLLDLDDSITDNRYKDQKLRLKRCGLRKVIYLVEGDPKSPHVSEKAKTACFTTEILDGFDILRTSGYAETERQYVYLTSSIIEYCNTNFSNLANSSHVCLTYNEFERRCKDFDKSKSTVSEIFALQLMQVPQLTEEAALAVIELYPTLISLARAYLELDGNTRAQEEMLQKKSKKVNAGASRNIFKLVWAEG